MSPIRWSILGVGTAGRARARVILDDPHSALVRVWQGRYAAELGVVVAATLDEAISEADAVAVCSPTPLHRAQVEAVLRAGRHCVCEFPLCQSAGEAGALFELADRMDRVLHVEHIELLEPAGRTLVSQVRPEVVERVTVSFERSGPADAGPPALAIGNVARLHRLCAVAGPIATIDTIHVEPGRLRAELTMTSGRTAALDLQQAPYLKRCTRLEVITPTDRWEQTDGTLLRNGKAVSLLGMRSLFGRDHAHAMGTITKGSPHYVSREHILHVLTVAERLGAQQSGPI